MLKNVQKQNNLVAPVDVVSGTILDTANLDIEEGVVFSIKMSLWKTRYFLL